MDFDVMAVAAYSDEEDMRQALLRPRVSGAADQTLIPGGMGCDGSESLYGGQRRQSECI